MLLLMLYVQRETAEKWGRMDEEQVCIDLVKGYDLRAPHLSIAVPNQLSKGVERISTP